MAHLRLVPRCTHDPALCHGKTICGTELWLVRSINTQSVNLPSKRRQESRQSSPQYPRYAEQKGKNDPSDRISNLSCEEKHARKQNFLTYRNKTGGEVTIDVVVEIRSLQQFSFGPVVPIATISKSKWTSGLRKDARSQLACIHEDGTEYVRTNTTTERRPSFLSNHLNRNGKRRR